MISEFKIGQTYNVAGLESPQRVIRITPNNQIVAISIIGRRCAPVAFSHDSWRLKLATHELVKMDDPNPIFSDYMTEENKKIQTYRLSAIGPLISDSSIMLDAKMKRTKIQERAAELGISANVLHNWLVKYWQSGCHDLSLINMYHKCGGGGKNRVNSTSEAGAESKKRGRPRHLNPGKGINVTPEIRGWIYAARVYYFKAPEVTKVDAYDMLLLDRFKNSLEIDEKGNIVSIDLGRCISYDQFLYWYSRDVSIDEEKREKYGKKHYDLNNRPISESSRNESIGPGFRGQMDSTRGDMQLVSSWSRLEPIGRPTVYFIIDVMSGMIGGIYISLESPSGQTAVRALLNATEDKVEFCKKYGIDITPEQWPTMDIPFYLSTDKGSEFMSQMMERFARLGGKEHPPAYRGDLRGIVERMFRELRRNFVGVEGFVGKDSGKRGAPDSRLKATWNLREFTAHVIKWVIEHNNKVNEEYPLDPDLIADGIATIPTDIWRWGVDNLEGGRREVPKSELISLLFEEDEAILNQGVLEYKGRYYESVEFLKDFEIRDALMNLKNGLVSFDPNVLEIVYLRHPIVRGQFVKYELKSDQDVHREMSLVDLEFMRNKRSRNNAPKKAQSTAVRLTRKANALATNKNAVAAKKAAGPDRRSKRAKIASMVPNRDAEMTQQKNLEKQYSINDLDSTPVVPGPDGTAFKAVPVVETDSAASAKPKANGRRHKMPVLFVKPIDN